MGFAETIQKVSTQICTHFELAQEEETVKQALILPFLSALGYDIHDPAQVRPEYTADFDIKPVVRV